jgi:hypothetical protein
MLGYMRTTEDWRREGLVVGEPSMRVSWNGPEPEWEHVLAHEIVLSPEQAREIFELLEGSESELQHMSKIEKKEQEQRQKQFLDLLAHIVVRHIREKGIPTDRTE